MSNIDHLGQILFVAFMHLVEMRVDCQHKRETQKIKCRKQVLGSAKVTTSIGDVVEQGVEVDKSSGIAVLREGGGILFMTLRTLLNNIICHTPEVQCLP